MGFRTPVSAIKSEKRIRSDCANLRVNFALAKFLGVLNRLILLIKKEHHRFGDGVLSLWGEIWDSNPRPSGPQPDALTN